MCAGIVIPNKRRTRISFKAYQRVASGDRVYRPNHTAMVPLLTLERTVSIFRRKGRSSKRIQQMTSHSNDLWMKDFPVDLELSRI